MSYSSAGQDDFILNLVGPNGYFVDVGASDGIHASNTLLLEENGWKGLCIDGVIENYDKMQQSRKCLTCCAIVDATEREVSFATQKKIYDGRIHLSGITEYYPTVEHLNAIVEKHGGIIEKKRTRTLQKLLKQYDCPKNIDYLSIDCEGADYAIISTFPFNEYNVKYISVESGSPKRFLDLLEPFGYRLIHSFAPWPDYLFGKNND